MLYVCALVFGVAWVGTFAVMMLDVVYGPWESRSPHFFQGLRYLGVFTPIVLSSGYGGYRLRNKQIRADNAGVTD